MQLQAVSVGSSVPQSSFNAVIHSVFGSAVNFHVYGLDTLLTLFFSDNTDLPQGIRLKQKDAFFTGGLTSGQAVSSRAGVLYLAGTAPSIDLRSARIWKSEIALRDTDLSGAAARTSWRIAAAALRSEKRVRQSSQLADEMIKPRISRGLQMVSQSAMCFDLIAGEQAASKLIGLGPGLTPAGDDVLVGFMAGLWAVSENNPLQHQFTRSFGEVLIDLSAQTNLISRTYLMQAGRGKFSSTLLALAQSICRGNDGETVRRAAELVFQAGHSSGLDSVEGLLAGLAAWNSNFRPKFLTLEYGVRQRRKLNRKYRRWQ